MLLRIAVILLVRGFALVPWLLGDKEESAVGVLDAAQQAEADDGGDSLHARRVQDDVFHLLRGSGGSLQRSRVGQLQRDVDIALILLGQKGSGQLAPDEHGDRDDAASRSKLQPRLCGSSTREKLT